MSNSRTSKFIIMQSRPIHQQQGPYYSIVRKSTKQTLPQQ